MQKDTRAKVSLDKNLSEKLRSLLKRQKSLRKATLSDVTTRALHIAWKQLEKEVTR